MLIGHPIGRWAVVAGCTVAVVVVAIVSTIMALYAASEVREAAGKPTPIGGDWSGVLAFGVGIVIAVLIVGVVMPAMLTGVVDHVAALAERREVARPVVAGSWFRCALARTTRVTRKWGGGSMPAKPGCARASSSGVGR